MLPKTFSFVTDSGDFKERRRGPLFSRGVIPLLERLPGTPSQEVADVERVRFLSDIPALEANKGSKGVDIVASDNAELDVST